MPGLFITFEGGERSGKTTQARLLAEWLTGRGLDCVVTREPGGTPLGEELRRLVLLWPAQVDPKAEALLFTAARAQLVAEVIRPALAAGKIVICDRYGDSTLAYQGYGLGLDLAELRQMNLLATGGLSPDVTFLLDMDPALAAVRNDRGPDLGLDQAEDDRIARRADEFHRRVRHGYRELAAAEPQRMRLIDGAQPADLVAAAIRRMVAPLLGARGLPLCEERARRVL